jgi:2-amino-4-hydroxy-6-hydroxymethyldihydropteridine diphosphokinase
MIRRAFVGVGSNLGDREAHLAAAARGLAVPGQVAVRRGSRVWDTAPLGPPQPRYLNAVLEIESALSAHELLRLLQGLEDAAGRRRAERWGARTLDLDLLLYGDEQIDEPLLRVPHPGLRQGRRFVLEPLAELCPELAIPGSTETVADLLAACPPSDLRAVGPYPLAR